MLQSSQRDDATEVVDSNLSFTLSYQMQHIQIASQD